MDQPLEQRPLQRGGARAGHTAVESRIRPNFLLLILLLLLRSNSPDGVGVRARS